MSYIIRFISGALIGLVIFAIRWSTAYFSGYELLTVTQEIVGCCLLSILCGLMTVKWGYKTLQTFLENFNW
jgi:hypothetical protein